MIYLKQSKEYPWMYYYRLRNNRWSKDYFNFTRASWYTTEEHNSQEKSKIVGVLRFQRQYVR